MKNCGVLLHISSLHSPYGIGTLGRAAYEFVDFLSAARQTVWEFLPLSPIGEGNSPYRPASVFAGNPYFIDLDMLDQQGLMDNKSYQYIASGDAGRVDYGMLAATRLDTLWAAYRNRVRIPAAEYEFFKSNNAHWLPDHALYAALRLRLGTPWEEWEDGLRFREEAVLDRYREELHHETEFQIFLQYLFYMQYGQLKKYAAQAGVSLVGELPLLPARDSADVWRDPELLTQGGENSKEKFIKWQEGRLLHASRQFDAVRLILLDEESLSGGKADAEEVNALYSALSDYMAARSPDFRLIGGAGEVSGLCRPVSLQTDLDADAAGCVAYTAYPFESSANRWFKNLPFKEKLRFREKNGMFSRPADAFIKRGFVSAAETVIVPMQDYLNCKDAGMCDPERQEGNWEWRMLPAEFENPKLAGRLHSLAYIYGRSGGPNYEQLEF